MNVGVASEVILSVLDVPVSDDTDRSGKPGVAGVGVADVVNAHDDEAASPEY